MHHPSPHLYLSSIPHANLLRIHIYCTSCPPPWHLLSRNPDRQVSLPFPYVSWPHPPVMLTYTRLIRLGATLPALTTLQRIYKVTAHILSSLDCRVVYFCYFYSFTAIWLLFRYHLTTSWLPPLPPFHYHFTTTTPTISLPPLPLIHLSNTPYGQWLPSRCLKTSLQSTTYTQSMYVQVIRPLSTIITSPTQPNKQTNKQTTQ